VKIERDFLRILEGGCSAPIGAHAFVSHEKIEFKAGVFSLDGQNAATLHNEVEIKGSENLAAYAAQEVLSNGGDEIMKTIKYSKE
jgi:hydroxymethylbilane synthase